MRLAKLVLVSASILIFGRSGWTQDANKVGKSTSDHGILGYLDPKTGTFKPKAQLGEQPDVTFTTVTGEFVFSFTITIKSTLPTGTVLTCGGSATVFEESSDVQHAETASVTATRSGSTATCTVTIPYSWALASASSDTVSLEYEVAASGGTSGLVARTSNHSLVPIKVPASGATTTETVAVTI
jgi:hypothetical protein